MAKLTAHAAAAKERACILAKARRIARKQGSTCECLEEIIKFIQTRTKRYHKRAGGL